MHLAAILLLALAGAGYCAAALQRWRSLGRVDGVQRGPSWLWIGFALHTLALGLSAADHERRDLFYAVLGVWASVAAVLFATRFIAGPNRGLLALPIGCMAILVAMAALAGGTSDGSVDRAANGPSVITILHIAFMATYLGAMFVAGGAAGLYLLAARQLKSASVRAFRLPELPTLERVADRGLVIATALLMGGISTGGAAMELTHGLSLANPTIIIALVNLGMLVLVLGARATHRLYRQGLAVATVVCMVVSAVGFLSLQVTAHG
ncbi:MAG: hypothetical protein H0V44_19255 [Planctomycetes bacterium]|nr:hypothetical protein [Planctomycetota bacterium]